MNSATIHKPQLSRSAHVFVAGLLALIIAVLAFGLSDTAKGQGVGDKVPAYWILRDSTVTIILLDPDLRDTLAFKSASGNVAIADSALKLKYFILKRQHFDATFFDSLIKLAVDSADYARALRSGAISSRQAFSTTTWDSLIQNWIVHSFSASYAENSAHAESTDYADESGRSQTTEQDTIPVSLVSLYANYAEKAGLSVDTTFVDSLTAALWEQIIDSIDYYNTVQDTATYALVLVDSVQDGTIRHYDAFTSALKTGYIPLNSQRLALDSLILGASGGGVPPGKDNPYVDSTSMRVLAVGNDNKNSRRLTLMVGEAASQSAGRGLVDTTGTAFRFLDWSGTLIVLEDTATIYQFFYSKLDSAADNYVQLGPDGPAKLWTDAALPFPSGTDGDWMISEDDTTLYLNIGGGTNWVAVSSGGGGGGAASSLTRSSGGSPVSSDSALIVTRDGQSIDAKITLSALFGDTTGFIRAGSSPGEGVIGIGFPGYPVDFIYAYRTATDTLEPKNWPTGQTIYFNGNIVPLGGYTIGSESFPVLLYTNTLYNTGTIWAGAYIKPSVNDSCELGGPSNRFRLGFINNYVGQDTFFIGTAAQWSNFQAGVQGINTIAYVRDAYAFTLRSENMEIQNGDFTISGNINNSSGSLNLTNGSGYVAVTSDSNAKIYGTSNKLYWLNSNDYYGLTSACGLAPGNGPVLNNTMKGFLSGVRVQVDGDGSFRSFFGNPWGWFADNLPTCVDSASADSMTVFIPQSRGYSSITPTPWTPINPPPGGWPQPAISSLWSWDARSDTVQTPRLFDTQNPAWRGEYIVGDQYSDSTGSMTGYWGTLQCALDSLPNVRVLVDKSYSNPKSYGFNPANAAAKYRVFLRRGTVVIDTLNYIPQMFRSAGCWLYADSIGTGIASHDTVRCWTSIDHWTSDTIAVVSDSTKWWPDEEKFTVVLARPWTVTIDPPSDGGMITVDSVRISNFCPVHIRGRGQRLTVLTNMDATHGYADYYGGSKPRSFTIFDHVVGTGTGPDGRGAGMPITISDMTIISAPSTIQATYVIGLRGRAEIDNLSLIANGASNRGIIEYLAISSLTSMNYEENSLVCNNIVVKADSDNCIFSVGASLRFESNASAYGLSGDSARVFRATSDLLVPPQFYKDEIWSNPARIAPTFMFYAATSQTGAAGKPSIRKCDFLGANYTLNANFTGLAGTTPYNYFDSNDATIPARLSEGQFMFQSPILRR